VSVRVLVVDDSAFFREVLRDVLSRYADLEIVGEAGDGAHILSLVRERRPDVVTMDVLMPLVGGVDAIRAIRAAHATAIVVLSHLSGGGGRVTLDAMAAGATDVFVKPSTGFDVATADRLVKVLRLAASTRPATVPARARPVTYSPLVTTRPRPAPPPRLIGVVASTGGPPLLRAMLASLPASFPIPIAIVQHTLPELVPSLASWLGEATRLRVRVVTARHPILPGEVVLAPGDRHLEVRAGMFRAVESASVAGHCPSGTVLLQSIARGFGASAVGIVLTGMGHDGADGLAAIADADGLAIVQDPATAAIDSMPRSAIAVVESPMLVAGDHLAALLADLGARK
jgi:two-component system, chemotaxis family, protein-glutamate methylesterase/glutaminase